MKKILKLASLVTAFCLFLSCGIFAQADEKEYKQGDIITFGSYPQSQVTDKNTITELNKQEIVWNDQYNDFYDKETDENIYTVIYSYGDTEINGEKYRAIKYPDVVIKNSSTLTNDTLWFKYEPIEWVIMDPETGYILCNLILDMQKFKYFENMQAEFNSPIPAAQWDVSDIRIWLNDSFYNAAFDKTEQKSISQTKTIQKITIAENEYETFETTDKIVLFSFEDVLDTKYGFETFQDCDIGYYQASEELSRGFTEYVAAINMFAHKDYEAHYYDSEEEAIYHEYTWFLRKTHNSQRPAEVYAATNKMSSYWVYDPTTGEKLYCDVKEGVFCTVDHFDIVFASETAGIVPAMHIDLDTFDKIPVQVFGDIDGDNTISSSDARLVLRASVGLETFTEELKALADVDKDGTVSSSDARLILRASVGLEDPTEW